VLAVFGSYGCALIAMIPVMLVHVPTTTLVSVGIASAMIHGTLLLLGAAKGPFWAGTVRATSYSFATHVLFAVPVVGVPIALIWTLVIETIGVREVHRTATVVAAIAVLGYRVLTIALVAAIYVLIGALVAGVIAGRA
jgi:hypothetical protein